jgi:hypothetical protein
MGERDSDIEMYRLRFLHHLRKNAPTTLFPRLLCFLPRESWPARVGALIDDKEAVKGGAISACDFYSMFERNRGFIASVCRHEDIGVPHLVTR